MREYRRFGFSLGLALNILGCIMFYREKEHFIWFTGFGSLALILAIIYPESLSPVKKILDFVLLCIGKLINVISLTIVFYLVFAPIGILSRLFKKDLLNQRIDKAAISYWIKKRNDVSVSASYECMG